MIDQILKKEFIYTINIDNFIQKSNRLQICVKEMKSINSHLNYEIYDEGTVLNLIKDLPFDIKLIDSFKAKIKGINKEKAVLCDLYRFCFNYLHGGLYLDADFFPIKPIDLKSLSSNLFFANISENPYFVAEAVVGNGKNSPELLNIIKRFLSKEPSGGYLSASLSRMCQDYHIFSYSHDFFIPHKRNEDNKKYNTTKNTYLIHLWSNIQYDLHELKKLQTLHSTE